MSGAEAIFVILGGTHPLPRTPPGTRGRVLKATPELLGLDHGMPGASPVAG